MSVANAVREHPILFSGEMVRAILEGRKTQTRRVVRRQPYFEKTRIVGGTWWQDDRTGRIGWSGFPESAPHELISELRDQCPYGNVGDVLWVRETFVLESSREYGSEGYPPPFTDGRPVNWVEDEDWGRYWEQAHYRATDPEPELAYEDTNEPSCRWRPSIFMPRWASRITLEITDVRVQRLQDISHEDATAEGALPLPIISVNGQPAVGGFLDPVAAFAYRWNHINGKRAHWSTNPWVWAITFKRAVSA